jgi:hypothetical protein
LDEQARAAKLGDGLTAGPLTSFGATESIMITMLASPPMHASGCCSSSPPRVGLSQDALPFRMLRLP